MPPISSGGEKPEKLVGISARLGASGLGVGLLVDLVPFLRRR